MYIVSPNTKLLTCCCPFIMQGRWLLCKYAVLLNPLMASYVGYAEQLPIVDDEMKKAAGDEKDEDIQMMQGVVQKLVTADGTYASQSAFSAMLPAKKEHVRSVLITVVICICSLT